MLPNMWAILGGQKFDVHCSFKAKIAIWVGIRRRLLGPYTYMSITHKATRHTIAIGGPQAMLMLAKLANYKLGARHGAKQSA
eukprot:5585867-Amphidinium_carterae.1